MRRYRRTFEVIKGAATRQLEGAALPFSLQLRRGWPGLRGAAANRLFLLRFDGLGFPASCHVWIVGKRRSGWTYSAAAARPAPLLLVWVAREGYGCRQGS